MFELNPVEARVLGCLIEKEINTPEYYPLSLNATLNACNQKSSREPVMELVESDVRTALFELSQMGLVRTIADARVSKFEHRVRDVLNLRRDEVAVLCLLLLRGPQTSAELRGRAERMYSFDDNAAVITTLERLAAQQEPLVVLLQRQPGAREARWSHLLSGAVSEAAIASAPQHDKPSEGVTERIAALEELLRSLEARVSALENPQDAG
jgi:uncharacterized protein YceH (UPF0502 family)